MTKPSAKLKLVPEKKKKTSKKKVSKKKDSKKKVSKKKVSKKKVSKKKVSKKKVSSKKVSKKKAVNKEVDLEKSKRFVTEEEKLIFLNGITEQKFFAEKIQNSEFKLQQVIQKMKTQIVEAKGLIEKVRNEKVASLANYNSHLDQIRKRLGFEGGFGINTDTNEVILHGEEE